MEDLDLNLYNYVKLYKDKIYVIKYEKEKKRKNTKIYL